MQMRIIILAILRQMMDAESSCREMAITLQPMYCEVVLQ
jgi:hypothetical protein